MKLLSVSSRAVIQLNYKPTLGFLDNFVSRSKLLEGEYEYWVYNSGKQTMLLYDPKKLKRLTVNPNRLEFVIENPTVEKLKEEVAQFYLAYFADSDIEEFGACSSLMLNLDRVEEDYSDYSSAFYNKFYKLPDDKKNIFSDVVTDVVVSAEGIKDGYQTVIRMAPLKSEQIDSFYPKEEYSAVPRIDKGIPVLTESRAYLKIASLKEEIVEKTEKAIELSANIQNGMRNSVKEVGND